MKGGQVSLIRRALKILNQAEIDLVVRVFHLLMLWRYIIAFLLIMHHSTSQCQPLPPSTLGISGDLISFDLQIS